MDGGGLAEAVRVRQASARDTPADLLRSLATDPRATVRASVALNPAVPPGVDRLVAGDTDERVRALLGRKLAGLLPQLSPARREAVGEHARAVLEILVVDEAARVRAAIADVVKEMPEAPRALILRLARDSTVSVSDPVIRLSPLLTPEDLLALLAQPPTALTHGAIACRHNLDAAVCDAIAATADPQVVGAMLANASAAIREATLDALVDRAGAQTAWHGPMVRRPALSGRAARALSEIVTTQLLEALARRADLPAEVTAELRARLARAVTPSRDCAESTPEAALAQARAMDEAGTLDEAAVLGRARAGDAVGCAAMLAVAAGVAVAVVDRATSLRSAKAIVSLTHSAGWSMRAAMGLQSVLGSLAPGAVLGAGPNGAYPLAAEEMRWQLDLLRAAAR